MNQEQEAWFFRVLHAGFAHKRKQLAKNLEAIAERTRVEQALREAGLALHTRAEDVPLSTWLALAKGISRS